MLHRKCWWEKREAVAFCRRTTKESFKTTCSQPRMAQETTYDDLECVPTAEQGTRSHHRGLQEFRHAVQTRSGSHTKATGAQSHMHGRGCFYTPDRAVECVIWRTRSNTKIWVLREETKLNFFSRKHIKAAGVRECECQGFQAPPVSPSSHSPIKTSSSWDDPPVSSPLRWAVLQPWAPHLSPAGVYTSVPRQHLGSCSCYLAATQNSRHAHRETYLSGGIRRGGVDVSTSEAVGLKYHCGNKGSVSGNQDHHRPSTHTHKDISTQPKAGKYPFTITLPEGTVMLLPGPLPFLIQTRLLRKAVTDNSNYQPVGRDHPPALLTIWPLSFHIRPAYV